MRIDLHNHTLDYQKIPSLSKKDLQNLYSRIIKHKDIDGFAITNYHNIDNALFLAEKLPKYIIVGCEYRVLELDSYIHVIALGLTPQIHQSLMSARIRGLEYFTNFLKEYKIPFFLARLGSGMPKNHEKSVRTIEKIIPYFEAIEVLNATMTNASQFARKLATYYHLTPIGGSDSTISEPLCRAYTEAPEAKNHEEFYQAIFDKKVSIGLTYPQNISHFASPNLWSWTKNFSLKKNDWGENLLPILQKIPKAIHIRRLIKHEQKISILETHFIDYLKLRETQRIFDSNTSLEGKKQVWQQAMQKIHSCFQ